jgi:hypothetical protein
MGTLIAYCLELRGIKCYVQIIIVIVIGIIIIIIITVAIRAHESGLFTPSNNMRADIEWYQMKEMAKLLDMKVLTYEIPV